MGHLLSRAGTEFVRNLLWMLMVFGLLRAISIAATDLPLVGVVAFVGVAVAVMAAIMTLVVLRSRAHEKTPSGGVHHFPGAPPDNWPVGSWDGGDNDGSGGGLIRASRRSVMARLNPP
jgi:hypothetical protein